MMLQHALVQHLTADALSIGSERSTAGAVHGVYRACGAAGVVGWLDHLFCPLGMYSTPAECRSNIILGDLSHVTRHFVVFWYHVL